MEMKADNAMEVIFDAKSENESFARVTAAAFCTRLDPTVEEIADIKTAVSEAVSNSIVKGYEGIDGKITVKVSIVGLEVRIAVLDDGIGIENVEQAMEPLYTPKPEQERSGMGFAFMEALMDELLVESEVGKGTTVRMRKKIGISRESFEE